MEIVYFSPTTGKIRTENHPPEAFAELSQDCHYINDAMGECKRGYACRWEDCPGMRIADNTIDMTPEQLRIHAMNCNRILTLLSDREMASND